MRTLALAMRPKKLDSMIGMKDLVEELRNQFTSRVPHTSMFVGQTGSGKTTLARILAVSLQCKHQEEFGNPCLKCYKRRGNFDIIEINAGDITGIDDLRNALTGWSYVPKPGSKYRVYIIDEAQGLSKSAQTLMFKYLEDSPSTTIWFICTTDPDKLLGGNVSRNIIHEIPDLDLDSVRRLVTKALKFIKSELDPDALADALMEKGVTSARKILNAVERYSNGATADSASKVDVISTYDVKKLIFAVKKGDWIMARGLLKSAKKSDARRIQVGITAYLGAILLDDEVSARATAVAKAIDKLTVLAAHEDAIRLAGVVSVLYHITKYFKEYTR